VLDLEDEVVIGGIEPSISYFAFEDGKWIPTCDKYILETYRLRRPITHKPEYLAVRSRDSVLINRLVKINQSQSNFAKGLIVQEGDSSSVVIHLKLKDGTLADKIWYTSFKTLLTHNSTAEFIEEKSEPFTSVKKDYFNILCNGYSCKHIEYCKFFNHSQSATLKTKGQSIELR